MLLKQDIPNVTPNLKRFDYNQSIGLVPLIGINLYHIRLNPVIYWANVGRTLRESKFRKFCQHIKNACGYRWDNQIMYIQYYGGSAYLYPFHCQIFFKESYFKKPSHWGVNGTEYGYEITIFDPIRKETLISVSGEITKKNQKMSEESFNKIREAIFNFHSTYINPLMNQISLDKTKKS